MHSCCLEYSPQDLLLGIDSNDGTEVALSFCGGLDLFLWVHERIGPSRDPHVSSLYFTLINRKQSSR